MKKDYDWDLTVVYKNEKELEKDYLKIKQKIEQFVPTDFLSSADKLYETLKEYYDIQMYLEKIYVYTSHKYDIDLSNNKNQAWKDKISDLYNIFIANTSTITPKLLEFGYDKIKEYYKKNKNIEKEYGFILEEIFRYEPYTLSAKEEKLIASLSKAYSDTARISGILSDSDLKFGTIKDENNNEIELNDTKYQLYIKSKSRKVRKDAFQTLYKTYKQFNNTYALLLSGHISKMWAINKVKKYSSSLQSALFDDNVSIDVYNNLIDVVSKNLNQLYHYYDIKTEALGLDKMHMYDIYTEISKESNKKYTFEEGKKLVIESLSILGEEYINNLKKAFEEKWIDVYPKENKRSGAYSGGTYLTNPYVLLNYKDTYYDISTMAHELGHSMHTYYSKENNPFQYSNYEIFVAEVASQVNELLFNNYMLNKVSTKEEKINILNQILELFKGSIYRQTMFAEFEKIIAQKNQEEEILTAEVLNETYLKLVKKYFGKNVIIDEEIKYEWQRIPHFYYNFYVYKYSTGLAAACYIVKNILEGKKDSKEKYLSFLKTGGSTYPLEELKIAGVDLTKPEVIQSAMDMFKEYLEMFEKLIKE